MGACTASSFSRQRLRRRAEASEALPTALPQVCAIRETRPCLTSLLCEEAASRPARLVLGVRRDLWVRGWSDYNRMGGLGEGNDHNHPMCRPNNRGSFLFSFFRDVLLSVGIWSCCSMMKVTGAAYRRKLLSLIVCHHDSGPTWFLKGLKCPVFRFVS